MANELAVRHEEDTLQVSRMLAMSGYFDAKGNSETAVAQVFTKVLAGREMGYGPFASVQGIHVIQGRPAVSANLMAAAVKGSGRYDYRVREMTDKICTLEFFQRESGKMESIGISTFTEADARKAGTKNMDKFPRNMLFARAMSNGVKWFCPDVFSGNAVYTPDELGADVDGDGNVIDVEYRSVDKATGEVLGTATQPPTNGNGNGHAAPPAAKTAAQPDDLPPEVAFWEKPEDAYEWAVGVGASENVFAARNAMKSIVDAHGGKFTKQNATEIYLAYYHDRMKRAHEKAAQAAEELAAEPDAVPEMAF